MTSLTFPRRLPKHAAPPEEIAHHQRPPSRVFVPGVHRAHLLRRQACEPAEVPDEVEAEGPPQQVVHGHARYAAQKRGGEGGRGQEAAFVNEIAEIGEQPLIGDRKADDA